MGLAAAHLAGAGRQRGAGARRGRRRRLATARWARALGATLIGTVGTTAKLAVVQLHLDYALATGQEDFAARVLAMSVGKALLWCRMA